MSSLSGKVRLSAGHDITLLKEVASQDPVDWREVATNISIAIGRTVTSRHVRERVGRLIDLYMLNDRQTLTKSGTEENYNEMMVLLEDLARQRDDGLLTVQDLPKGAENPSSSKQKEKEQAAAGAAIRDNAMKSLGKRDAVPAEPVGCTPKKPRISDVVMARNDLRKQELELANRRMALDEEPLRMDRQRHDAEREERRAILELLAQLSKK